MLVRFDIRPDDEGWTIYDRITGAAAVIDGFVSAGLSYAEADDLVDLFNTLDLLRRQGRSTVGRGTPLADAVSGGTSG